MGEALFNPKEQLGLEQTRIGSCDHLGLVELLKATLDKLPTRESDWNPKEGMLFDSLPKETVDVVVSMVTLSCLVYPVTFFNLVLQGLTTIVQESMAEYLSPW